MELKLCIEIDKENESLFPNIHLYYCSTFEVSADPKRNVKETFNLYFVK